MIRRPPRPPLFPYPTLFRSVAAVSLLTLFLFAAGANPRALGQSNDPDRALDCPRDRKSTRLNSSHRCISYAVFCLKKKNTSATTLVLARLSLSSSPISHYLT